VGQDEVCAYKHTIAVGRSSRLDLDDGSAYGRQLDFLAPGVEVYSTRQGGQYGTGTGTSYAAPCAASIAALLAAINPTLSWSKIRDKLRQGCDKIGSLPYSGKKFGGRNDTFGYGRVNAENTVR
jgi:thermitase